MKKLLGEDWLLNDVSNTETKIWDSIKKNRVHITRDSDDSISVIDKISRLLVKENLVLDDSEIEVILDWKTIYLVIKHDENWLLWWVDTDNWLRLLLDKKTWSPIERNWKVLWTDYKKPYSNSITLKDGRKVVLIPSDISDNFSPEEYILIDTDNYNELLMEQVDLESSPYAKKTIDKINAGNSNIFTEQQKLLAEIKRKREEYRILRPKYDDYLKTLTSHQIKEKNYNRQPIWKISEDEYLEDLEQKLIYVEQQLPEFIVFKLQSWEHIIVEVIDIYGEEKIITHLTE